VYVGAFASRNFGANLSCVESQCTHRGDMVPISNVQLYNTFPIVAASAKGQRRLGPTARKAVLGLFVFQTSLPDDPSILSISLTGLTRQPVLTAYTTSAPTTTTILILREEIPSSGKRTRQETYPSSILRPSMASSSLALPPISLLLALLLLSAPSPSACASLSFLTASSNGSASTSADPELEDLAPEPTFLEEVIDAVSEKYDWDPDAEVRVWPLDAGAVRRRGRGVETPLRAGRRGGGWAGRGRRRPRRRRVRVRHRRQGRGAGWAGGAQACWQPGR
jgi:hypothetical protein